MKENGFEYVDLGFPSGTMWATCNVGATKPEDEGLLFQFGRVDGYKYGDKNHKFRMDYKTTTSGKKYNAGETLQPADDAASVNMGGKWRMPTNSQLEELLNNTTHNVETINDVKGMMFTSNINGHKMFIPFMQGCWYNEEWQDWCRSYIYMWSSQTNDSNVNNAYRLYCISDGYTDVINSRRASALSVRGVFKK